MAAPLTKLDHYQATLKANAKRLTECLEGTQYLILPREYPKAESNWYNYTNRFDFKAMGHEADAREFRDKLVKAMQAEGVATNVWQNFILPAMTVFQAKNGYGNGCPWNCQHASPVSYDLGQYTEAQRHTDTHTGMTTPLRAPNSPVVAEYVAKGIRKVLANIDQVEKIVL